MKIYKKILFVIIPVFVLFVVSIVRAQIELQVALPTTPGRTVSSVSGLSEYIRIIYDYGIYAGSVLAVIMISIFGFKWVAAGGNKGAIEKAKSGMLMSITGLFLFFGSYLILSTINGELVALTALDVKTITPIEYIEQTIGSLHGGLDPNIYDPRYYAPSINESEGGGHIDAVAICGTAAGGRRYYCVDFSINPDIDYEFGGLIIGACPDDTQQCRSKNSDCGGSKFCTNYNNCGAPSNGYCDGLGPQVCCREYKKPINERCSESIQCVSGCCCNRRFPTYDTCNSARYCNSLGLDCKQ